VPSWGYAAGPLILNQELTSLGCLRSDHNFAHLAAAQLGQSLARQRRRHPARPHRRDGAEDRRVAPGHPRARAAGARVFVVNYAAILPETGSGCWPTVPIARADVPYLRGIEKALNAMLADRAAANNATIVDHYTASIGHDACESTLTKWVEPLIPTNPAAPFHPNARGEAGVAAVVARGRRLNPF
jgi:GDSL-like lipase/acylhydrolase family protein